MDLKLFLIISPFLIATTASGSYQSPFYIPYRSAQFPGVSSPDCGKEIRQLDVSRMSHPHQIRLSYTGDPTEMALTWTTNGLTHHEIVNYGLLETDLSFSSLSISHQYNWNWDESVGEYYYTSGFIHEAHLVNLIPGRIHFYQIESNGLKSDIIRFIAAPEPGSNTPVSFLHIGDVGTFGTSVMVTANMMKRMEEKQFHGLLHCGDISYANKFNGSKPDKAEQKVWDTWGQMVEPVGSKMAYMVTPGNHELAVLDSNKENVTIFTKRFIMPGNERYYTFSVGLVYVLSVSTDESIDAASTQGVWLDRKLKKINENREKWPWVVIFLHRPIYNSNKNHGNWTGSSTYYEPGVYKPTHRGWPDEFEALILKHNVDIVLSGHVHHYERTWPVRNRNIVTKSYKDVKDPIHITCGHGGKTLYRYVWGTKENSYEKERPAFSSARYHDYWGHCEIEFHNSTTATHKMFKMSEGTPTEEVSFTKRSSKSAKATLHQDLFMLIFVFVVVQ